MPVIYNTKELQMWLEPQWANRIVHVHLTQAYYTFIDLQLPFYLVHDCGGYVKIWA